MLGKLKRCPFCGAKAKRKEGKTVRNRYYYEIVCKGCLATIRRIGYSLREDNRLAVKTDAIVTWNTRAKIEEEENDTIRISGNSKEVLPGSREDS
jgi:Lar family restriction alleviation protein